MHLVLLIAAWAVGLVWLSRSFSASVGLPSVPDLRQPQSYDTDPTATVTVIVPGRNEAAGVGACLDSLLAQDYQHLHIIAVDDRSDDATGSIMLERAAAHPGRLAALHITSLPPDWLGKTHAMARAAEGVTSDFLLFTDADVLFDPTAIRRALANAIATRADHLVLVPTTLIRRWDEAALLSFFSVFGIWASRPWKVADPDARRDALGIGAFNLIRRTAYEAVGGWDSLRMAVVEDLGIARRIKRAGLRQRVAFGQGLVSLHWAAGVNGLVNVLTKNLFAAVNFYPALLLGGCLWLAAFCIAPFLGFFIPGFTTPCTIAIVSLAWAYILMGRASGLSPWNALLAPFAAAILIFALLRSMITTLAQGGIVWRGTFYPLKTLRGHLPPLR